MPKKKVPAKSEGKSLQKASDVQKMLAQYVTEDAAREIAGGGNTISIRGGKFSHQGATLGREIDVIILDFSHVKSFYLEDFDEDNPQPPGCMAVSHSGKDMVPVDGVPSQQAEACSVCQWNKFGTAAKGKGKACKDGRRLAVISADAEDMEDAEIAIITVPPASLKNWIGYERNLHSKLKVPPIGVVTKIAMDEDAEYTTLDFKVKKPITNKKIVEVLLKRREEAQAMLLSVPDFSGVDAGDKKLGRVSKKKGGKKDAKETKPAKAAKGGKGASRSKFQK